MHLLTTFVGFPLKYSEECTSVRCWLRGEIRVYESGTTNDHVNIDSFSVNASTVENLCIVVFS